jgi:hypothetical protein
MKIEDYSSVRKWKSAGIRATSERPYGSSSWRLYVGRLENVCDHLKMTPDELANVSQEKAMEIQNIVDNWLRVEKREQEYTTVHDTLVTLRMFWKANGVHVVMHKRYLREKSHAPR